VQAAPLPPRFLNIGLLAVGVSSLFFSSFPVVATMRIGDVQLALPL
jgi:hypothetical protein